MTGMPAFGTTHKDEEIWKIVAFVRRLPELPPDDVKALRAAAAAAEH
jgi:mono/diheme cytochrome c family protein